MRIGIDASRAARPQRTGTEAYSLHLIRGLLALDPANDYTLYCDRQPEPGLLPGRPGAALRVIPFPRLWTHLRLSAEMLRRPPDVLLVPAHVLPLVHPRRSLVTVHDLGYLYEPEAHRPTDRLYLDLSNRYHARAAARILAISRATRDDLVTRYGVPADRVTITYLAADASFRPVADPAVVAAARAGYGIGLEYILYVGTLQPRKNLARLIRAFARLAPAHSGLQLVLAGKKGWLYGDILQEARRLGVEGRVLFPGYVSAADLPALYSGALAFAFPSLYEGFGMPALEAMACGTPVVTSNLSSLPEVVGDAGLLVDPTDEAALAAALEGVIAGPALRAALRERGLERARLFSWERCARETLAAIRETAGV